jgi:prepilin-type N-terminal cleavage/methylation domain-containing protein
VKHRSQNRSGFTLVELMIGSAVGAIVMAALLSTYTFLGRAMARLASYHALENESRKALAYLAKDFALAQKVKAGTSPSSSTVTLVLPLGEVAYTYDGVARSLRRQANFGASSDLTFLHNDSCECTTFELKYFTTTDGAPTDQSVPATTIPYSVKRIQVRYIVESPSSWSAMTRTRLETASGRYSFHNRTAPDGT